jgi:hypothetical protein
MNREQYIFDLSNPKHKYKGVLFAEIDNDSICEECGGMAIPQNFVAGVMAIIWVDEENIWNVKTRFKFPSGNKQIFEKKYDNEDSSKINETFILHDLYRFPMVNKRWFQNKDETAKGLFDLMQQADMIEYAFILPEEDNEAIKGR